MFTNYQLVIGIFYQPSTVSQRDVASLIYLSSARFTEVLSSGIGKVFANVCSKLVYNDNGKQLILV